MNTEPTKERIIKGIAFFRNLSPEQRVKPISLQYLDTFLSLVEQHLKENKNEPVAEDPDDNTKFAEAVFGPSTI